MATQKKPPVMLDIGPGDENPLINMYLQRAQDLADERDAVSVRIVSNRSLLRDMRTDGLLSDEQAAAIEEFYPTRTRNNSGDAETSNGDDAETSDTSAGSTEPPSE